MNQFGKRMRKHWGKHAPSRMAALPDPTTLFAQAGMEIQAKVTRLAQMLAGPDPRGETYVQKVARVATARKTAEEVVMSQWAWINDPELPLDQAREEWEQTRPSDENLISWAERMQDSPDLMPSSVELEQMARDWALSVEFLQALVATEPPREWMRANQGVLREAATIRFLRDLR